jgi:hypothetical protein
VDVVFLIMNDTLTSMKYIWSVNNLPLNHVFQECMSQAWFVCHVLLLGVSLYACARYLIAWALKGSDRTIIDACRETWGYFSCAVDGQ